MPLNSDIISNNKMINLLTAKTKTSKMLIALVGALSGKNVWHSILIFRAENRLTKRRETSYKVIVFMYLWYFLPLNPSWTTVCSVCILPPLYSAHSAFCILPAFYSQSAVCIVHSVCILPLVRSVRLTLTVFRIIAIA